MNKLMVVSLMLLLLVSLVSASGINDYPVRECMIPEGCNAFDGRDINNFNASLIRATKMFQERFNLSCDGNCSFEFDKVDSIAERYSVAKVERVRFLGFTFDARETFVIDSDGYVLRQRSNFMQTLRNWGLVNIAGEEKK